MEPERNRIWEIVKTNVLRVMPDVRPEEITLETSLTDLGANSIDRVEVAMYSLEDLNLRVPPSELQGLGNLRGLVDLLQRHLLKR